MLVRELQNEQVRHQLMLQLCDLFLLLWEAVFSWSEFEEKLRGVSYFRVKSELSRAIYRACFTGYGASFELSGAFHWSGSEFCNFRAVYSVD